MNSTIQKIILLLAVAGITAPLQAKVANKTYFSGRNELQNTGRLWAAGQPYSVAAKNSSGLKSDVFLFASQTKNTVGLGQYFGASLKDDCSDANGTVIVSASADAMPNGLFDRQIDHTYSIDTTEAAMTGTLKLAPVQKRLGAVLSAAVDLGQYFDIQGWHVAVTAPLVQVKNNLGVTYPRSSASHVGNTKVVTTGSTIEQFFAGNYRQAGGNSQQDLNYGKVQNDNSISSGLADMKITVGYDVVRELDGCVQVNAGIIVPLGKVPTAERLFEAVHGNGGHIGLVAGAHGDVRVWENKAKRMAAWLSGNAEYTFLFESTETRIAGVYNYDQEVMVPWGHTALGVQLNQAGTFPLANVLARPMTVMPGSHFEATLGGSFVWNDFYINLGYNMYYKKAETVDMLDQWPTDRYGMAAYQYAGTSAATNFNAASLAANTGDAVGALNTRYNVANHLGNAVHYQVEVAAAAAPDQELHQAVLGAGYRRVMKNIPVTMSVVASYELSKDRTKAPNAWGLGVRVGVAL